MPGTLPRDATGCNGQVWQDQKHAARYRGAYRINSRKARPDAAKQKGIKDSIPPSTAPIAKKTAIPPKHSRTSRKEDWLLQLALKKAAKAFFCLELIWFVWL